MTYPIRAVPDNDTAWGADLRATIAGVNDHQTRLVALESGIAGVAGAASAAANTAAIQAAATSLPATGGTVLLQPGTYPINATTITGGDGLTIDGAGAVLTCASGDPLTVTGTRTVAVTTVTANITAGSATITVASSASLTVGDMVLIRSATEVFGTERPDQYYKGEIATISVIAGTTVTLASRTFDSYATASGTINVDKIVPIRNVTIRNIRIVGAGASGSQHGIRVQYFDGATVDNVTVDACEYEGIVGRVGTRFLATGNRVTRVKMTGLGYGVRALGVQGARLEGNTGYDNRHSLDTDWDLMPSRLVSIVGNTAVNDSSAGISTHGGAELVDVVGNFVRHCGGGLVIRSGQTRVQGNYVYGTRSTTESDQSYLHGITLGDDGVTHTLGVGIVGVGLQVLDNHIRLAHPTPGSDNIFGIYCTASLTGARIAGNNIAGHNHHGMWFKGDKVDTATFADNVIDCSSQLGTPGTTFVHGIYIGPATTTTGNNQKHLRITRNDVRGALYSAIRVNGNIDAANPSDDIVITDNILRGYGLRGVDFVGGYFARTRIDRNAFPDGGASANQLNYVAAQMTTPPDTGRDLTLLATGEESIPRWMASASNTAHPGTGVLWLTFFTARKSDTGTAVKWAGGNTAAGATPTLIRWGLYEVQADASLTLVASTPNDTTLFGSTFSYASKSYSAGYARVAGRRYAHGLLIVSAAAMPTFYGVGGSSAAWGTAPMLCSQVGSLSDLPSTITSGSLSATTPGKVFYVELSP